MKKEDFKKMKPNMNDMVNAFNLCYIEEESAILNRNSFDKGVFWVLKFLEDKFSDFTENEQLAIEEYKTNKISAVKFLMSESNYGLKEAKDFLDKHSNLSVQTHEA
jgi:hypothetical protein